MLRGIFLLLFLTSGFAQSLTSVSSWGYQLQNISIERLKNSSYELLVMDYSSDGTEEGKFSSQEIASLKDAGKIPICYISIGEAESYRFYWNQDWNTNPPAFLGPENPDWEGNYKVRFWDPQWQNIVFSYIDTVLKQGFSGIYMDIIDAYYYWSVENPEEPKADSLMIQFVLNIRKYLLDKGVSNFYLLPQNASEIISAPNVSASLKQKYFEAIDGIGVEDVFFPGNLPENNSFAPDTSRIRHLREFLANGKQVFSIEYITQEEKINTFLQEADKENFVPYYCTRELNVLCEGKLDERDFLIYPNPSEGFLQIYIKEFPFEGGTFSLYDSRGNLLLSKPLTGNAFIEELELPNGIYLVKIQTSKFKKTKKWGVWRE